MKLAEKFRNMVLDVDIADWEKECVSIADEFAIEFAEWCAYYQISKVHNDLWISNLLFPFKCQDNYSMKQLLEIYKKEKGL